MRKYFWFSVNYLRDRIQSTISKNPWYYITGSEPISINSLMSPLRYDIVIRIDYFKFLEANFHLFQHDFQQYTVEAMQHPYFTWFTEIVCRRFFPSLFNNKENLIFAFKNRLRKSTELYLRFQKMGFDSQNPITLHSGEVILPTSTGKRINMRYYAGDGCHRIALLKLAGYEYLPDETYRIRCFCKLSPIDNTYLLIRPLSIDRRNYFRFLSCGYSDKSFKSKELLVEHVRNNDPMKLNELKSIIEKDEQALTDT